MKKLLLIAIILLPAFIKAQQYVPFPDSNAYWNEVFFSDQPNYKYTYFMKGDTTIDSLLYHKIYSDDSTTISYIGGLREYKKRIYFFNSYCTHNILLYDFNLTMGDSMRLSCIQPMCDTATNFYAKVTSIDSVILTDMKYRKRLNFDDVNSYPSWIEGIGSMSGLLYPSYYCSTCMCFIESVCFKQNDTILYVNPNDITVPCFDYISSINELNNKTDLITIFPNPATEQIQIKGEQSKAISIDIYNMLGVKNYSLSCRQASSTISIDVSDFPSGVYILEVHMKKGVMVRKFVKE